TGVTARRGAGWMGESRQTGERERDRIEPCSSAADFSSTPATKSVVERVVVPASRLPRVPAGGTPEPQGGWPDLPAAPNRPQQPRVLFRVHRRWRWWGSPVRT